MSNIQQDKTNITKRSFVVEMKDKHEKDTLKMKFERACGNRGCYPGEIHCSPGTGGGCCPRHHPVCCGNGIHCRRYGPC